MSGPDEALSSITHQLQSAVSSNDRSQVFQLLPHLLQSLPVSPHQRHLPTTQGLRLLQLGAQGLNLSTGNLQVCHNLYVSKILVCLTEHSYTLLASQAQQAGCQVLRAVSQATIGLQEVENDQVQPQPKRV